MKKFLRKEDLALYGARPAFSDPVHVGRPNIGDKNMLVDLLGEAIDRAWLTNDGPLVRELERQVASYLGAKHCIAMCNGTIALEIGIRAAGLTGEVILPSYTFVATAHALYWQGLKPVFADIDPATHNLDPEAVRQMITPRTSGIIGVHLWGRPAPVKELQEIADEYGLKLLFDAAHGFGCSSNGRMLGNFGEAEVLSFHATKFFNTFEGGAVVTNDDDIASAARLMRNFGFAGYDNVVYPGTNGKMIEPCAAMGLVNLNDLDAIIEANYQSYSTYAKVVAELPGISLIGYNESESNNYQYIVLEVSPESPVSRDHLVAALHAENILARKYFWPGCHGMKPYSDLYPDAGLMLPLTERVAASVVVMPTGKSILGERLETILSALRLIVSTGEI